MLGLQRLEVAGKRFVVLEETDTQQRLAKLAGVRQETIARFESGKHSASVKTVDRIDRAIQSERRRLG
jgi:predicted transcriptional regulator